MSVAPAKAALVAASEAESLAHLDHLLNTHGLVRNIYTEVNGYVDQPRFLSEDKPRLRIDRIYSPSAKLCDAGWTHGPFGVEGKDGGKRLGPALAQAADYARCTFQIQPGYHIKCEWYFLWPYEPQTGDIASVMCQQRCGTVCTSAWRPLQFAACYGQNALVVHKSGRLEVKRLKTGKKRGSR